MDNDKSVYVRSAFLYTWYISAEYKYCQQIVKLSLFICNGEADWVYLVEGNQAMDCVDTCR